ncbi:hypothetical protein KY284_030043 [Solanum tuberosum]|nr:hypothetical protein KY284_030043 [Solanum tuberosum]
MEASKIRHLPHEEELVQTLIRSLDGIYYKTLYFAGGMRFKPYDPQVSQLKRLWAKGLLRPRKGWICKHSSSTFDLSKNCAYHSNIQGHETEECPALRNKI